MPQVFRADLTPQPMAAVLQQPDALPAGRRFRHVPATDSCAATYALLSDHLVGDHLHDELHREQGFGGLEKVPSLSFT